MHRWFWWGILGKTDHLEDAGVQGNIEMGLKETELEGINWIALAKNRGKWLVFLNMIKKLRIPQYVGTSLIE